MDYKEKTRLSACRGYITEVDPRSTMRPFVRTMTLDFGASGLEFETDPGHSFSKEDLAVQLPRTSVRYGTIGALLTRGLSG